MFIIKKGKIKYLCMELFHVHIEFLYISYGINKVQSLDLIEDVCCNLIKKNLNKKHQWYVYIYQCCWDKQMNWSLKFHAFFCTLHH